MPFKSNSQRIGFFSKFKKFRIKAKIVHKEKLLKELKRRHEIYKKHYPEQAKKNEQEVRIMMKKIKKE